MNHAGPRSLSRSPCSWFRRLKEVNVRNHLELADSRYECRPTVTDSLSYFGGSVLGTGRMQHTGNYFYSCGQLLYE